MIKIKSLLVMIFLSHVVFSQVSNSIMSSKLKYFEVEVLDLCNFFKWEVKDTSSNNVFVIYKSFDGINWYKLVETKEINYKEYNYTWRDYDDNDIVYYRIYSISNEIYKEMGVLYIKE
jgi:hypothetical protein